MCVAGAFWMPVALRGMRAVEGSPGPLEPPTPVKTGALERSPGPLEPPTPVKTGTLKRSPGPLEPPPPVKTGALERSPGPLEPQTLEKWNAGTLAWAIGTTDPCEN